MNLAAGESVVPASLEKNASFIRRLLVQKIALLGLVLLFLIACTALGAPLTILWKWLCPSVFRNPEGSTGWVPTTWGAVSPPA
jgi:hypothetical protein